MTMVDFITELFYRVAVEIEQEQQIEKHSQAKLYPSEVVTLAQLFALRGVGQRAFWRWLTRDYQSLFPQLPDRTRMFRLPWTSGSVADKVMQHSPCPVLLVRQSGEQE